MVENVFIKVGEFIFSIDFVVLETEVVTSPENEISIILGQPLVTILMLLLIVGVEK